MALYIRFIDTTVTTEVLGDGLPADYDTEGNLAGIEILDALKRAGETPSFENISLDNISGPRIEIGRLKLRRAHDRKSG
jgi:uncharacterized protein YuzE